MIYTRIGAPGRTRTDTGRISYFFLYPEGQTGLAAVTFLVSLPLTQVMVVAFDNPAEVSTMPKSLTKLYIPVLQSDVPKPLVARTRISTTLLKRG